MDGRKVVIAILALVILVASITFALYLLTRQVEDESGTGPSPNAMEMRVEFESTLFRSS